MNGMVYPINFRKMAFALPRTKNNLPAKAATLSPLKIVKSSLFETDNYCMLSGSFGHLRLKM